MYALVIVKPPVPPSKNCSSVAPPAIWIELGTLSGRIVPFVPPMPICSVPALTVVPPVKGLVLVKMIVPPPIFLKAVAPVPFCMTPSNVETASLSPTTRMPVAELELVTTPVPVKPLTVAVKPFKSRMPLASTKTPPLPAPCGRALSMPICSVPLVTVVPPE